MLRSDCSACTKWAEKHLSAPPPIRGSVCTPEDGGGGGGGGGSRPGSSSGGTRPTTGGSEKKAGALKTRRESRVNWQRFLKPLGGIGSVDYCKRAVRPLPEEARGIGLDPDFWKAMVQELEHEVIGEGGVPLEAAWDALTPQLLTSLNQVLGIPFPPVEAGLGTAERVESQNFWVEMPLPPELDHMNVVPSEPDIADWRFAEIPADDPTFRTYKRGSDINKIELPAWYRLAKQSIQQTTDGQTTLIRKRIVETLEEEVEEKEKKKEGINEGEEEEEEEVLDPEPELVETESQRRARETLEEEQRIQDMLLSREIARQSKRVTRLVENLRLKRQQEEVEELAASEELERQRVDLEVHPPSTCPRDQGQIDWPFAPRNPYYKFLRKPLAKAAMWRKVYKPQASGGAMDTHVLLDPKFNLLEKANHITQTITMEFLEWMDSLGGVEESDLSSDTLQQLFDVTFDLPAARALCVRVRELPVVTRPVADAAFAPQAEVHEGLRHMLRQDVDVEEQPKHTVAFGRHLQRCCPQRFVPPCNDVRRTWVDCGRLPEELATSKEVFNGITQLQSVKKFCEYLERNPRLAVPPYLRTVGMVGLKGPKAERVRRRGGFTPASKRPKPKPWLARRRSSLGGLTSVFQSMDSQTLQGHGNQNYRFSNQGKN